MLVSKNSNEEIMNIYYKIPLNILK